MIAFWHTRQLTSLFCLLLLWLLSLKCKLPEGRDLCFAHRHNPSTSRSAWNRVRAQSWMSECEPLISNFPGGWSNVCLGPFPSSFSWGMSALGRSISHFSYPELEVHQRAHKTVPMSNLHVKSYTISGNLKIRASYIHRGKINQKIKNS